MLCKYFYNEMVAQRLVVLQPPLPLYKEKLGRPCYNLEKYFENDEEELARVYWRSKQVGAELVFYLMF